MENPKDSAPTLNEDNSLTISIPHELKENQNSTVEQLIAEDMKIANAVGNGLIKAWGLVDSVDSVIKLGGSTMKFLEQRRRLANKQLGAKEDKGSQFLEPEE